MSQVTTHSLDCCCNSPSCYECEGTSVWSIVLSSEWNDDYTSVSTTCECYTCFPRYPTVERSAFNGEEYLADHDADYAVPLINGDDDEVSLDCCLHITCPDASGGKLYQWNGSSWDIVYECCKDSATSAEPPIDGQVYSDGNSFDLYEVVWVCCIDPCDCSPAGYTWWVAKTSGKTSGDTISWEYVEDNCNSACAKQQPPPDFVLGGNSQNMPNRWYTRTCCTAGCVSCTQESMYDPDEDLLLTIAGVTGLLENAGGYSPPAGTIDCDGAVANDVWSAILNKSWSIPTLYPTGGGCQFSLTENLCTIADICGGGIDATTTLTITVTFTSTETTVVFQLATGCGGLGQTRTFVKTHSGSLNCKSIGGIPFSSKSFSGYGGDPTTMYGLDASGMSISIP